MTKDDTKKMIMYLRAAYPGFCEGEDLANVLKVWHDAFKDENTSVVSEATRNYTRSSKFPPTIAGIQEQINLIKRTDSDAELWAAITKAAKNSTYGAAEEFEKLPEICQQFIGSASALKDLGQISPETLQTVVKGQFAKTAPQIRQHRDVQRGLPADVRAVIEYEKMRLLEHEEI